jgi:hypothetical protein
MVRNYHLTRQPQPLRRPAVHLDNLALLPATLLPFNAVVTPFLEAVHAGDDAGGGHNVAGNAVNDGGLVIDLSQMKGIQVDPVKRTARAQAGVTWGNLDRETQVFGRATTGGAVSMTGTAGFTLTGGMGLLHRQWGLACDNLLSAEVVTADGEVVRANAVEHPDLCWALRGRAATSARHRLRGPGRGLDVAHHQRLARPARV